jgi:hypothetical protein
MNFDFIVDKNKDRLLPSGVDMGMKEKVKPNFRTPPR